MNVLSKIFKSINAKRIAGSFGLKILNTLLTVTVSIVLSRLLGAAGFGTYIYALSWTTLLSFPATLGLDVLLTRNIAIYKTRNQWELIKGITQWSSVIVAITSIVFSGLAIWAVHQFGKFDQTNLLSITLCLISLPILVLRNLKLATIRGFNKILLSQIPELLIMPGLLLLITFILSFKLKNQLEVTHIVLANIAVILVTLLVSDLLLKKIWIRKFLNTIPNYKPQEWIAATLPFIFIGAAQVLTSRTDIVMLGSLKDSSSVGLYAVASRAAQFVVFMQVAVINSLGPTIASLYAEGKREELQRVTTKSAQLVFTFSTVVVAILIGFRRYFLGIFGTEFQLASTALIILVFGKFINASSGPVGLLLSMTGNQGFRAATIITGALINIVGNSLLIPKYGIIGAAIATTSTMIFVNLLNIIWVFKQLNINPTPFRIL